MLAANKQLAPPGYLEAELWVEAGIQPAHQSASRGDQGFWQTSEPVCQVCWVRSPARENPVSALVSRFQFLERYGTGPDATSPSEAEMYRVKVQYKVGCVQPCI